MATVCKEHILHVPCLPVTKYSMHTSGGFSQCFPSEAQMWQASQADSIQNACTYDSLAVSFQRGVRRDSSDDERVHCKRHMQPRCANLSHRHVPMQSENIINASKSPTTWWRMGTGVGMASQLESSGLLAMFCRSAYQLTSLC